MNQSSQKKDCSACSLVHANFLLGLFFNPEDGDIRVPPKHQLTLDGLRGVVSEMIELFILLTWQENLSSLGVNELCRKTHSTSLPIIFKI
jgi:hypothetical protein